MACFYFLSLFCLMEGRKEVGGGLLLYTFSIYVLEGGGMAE